ncbi:cytokine receptor-like [Drosophila bipectinata]|uniref:cytokine receptor-like n=1 Tax=Drosophila bipectinata TaxID=42026 RepID=UPI0038B3FFF2
MHSFNFAVAARYSDKVGGGMRWTGYRWIQANPSGAGFSYYAAPIGVSGLWILRPWNPKIRLKQRIFPKYFQLNNTYCLGEHLHAYQTFECYYSCRFKFHNAPWGNVYVYNYTTLATLPERPPTIPLQGFYYDQERRQLHIFWFHLYELEWNGPNFTYIVKPDNENISKKGPTFFGNMQAIFNDWDASISTTIRIRSKNSEGLSANSSEIKIPILNKVQQQHPKNLQYNNEKQILTWDPPSDQDNLIGYTVFWCIDSATSLHICHEQQNISTESLNSSQFQLKFWNSMHSFNLAVAARYSDKVGGGMRWTGYRWIQANPSGAGFSYYAAPIGVSGLVILSIYLYRMCRKCSDIDVVLPEGLELDTKVTSFSHAEVIIPGNLSPEVVMDIKHLMTTEKHEIKNEPQSVLSSRINQDQNTIITTESNVKCSVTSTNNSSIATGSYSTTPVKSSAFQNSPEYELQEFPKEK